MSPKYQLNKQDLKKVGAGALIVIIGALLTYLPEEILRFDWGNLAPIVMVLLSIVVHAGYAFISGKEQSFDIPSVQTPTVPNEVLPPQQ